MTVTLFLDFDVRNNHTFSLRDISAQIELCPSSLNAQLQSMISYLTTFNQKHIRFRNFDYSQVKHKTDLTLISYSKNYICLKTSKIKNKVY